MRGSLLISLSLLIVVPLTALLRYILHASPIVLFVVSGAGVAILADWVRRGTDQLAARTGPAIGGLVNVSFGNLGELILAVFVLMRGEHDIVRAQITGSIMATTLLGLGLAAVFGGLRHDAQRFQPERARLLATLLILAVVALLLPAVFAYTGSFVTHTRRLHLAEEDLSLGVSVVLLGLYGANMIYTLVTRRDAFAREEGGEKPKWSLGLSLGVLIAATVAVAFESDIFSTAMTEAAGILHINQLFLGVVVLALVGTIADLVAGVYFATQGRIGLVVNICIGSATQIALAVAPLLVVISWIVGNPMSLVFANPLELFAIAGAVYVVNAIAGDGELSWFEGVLLIGVYVLFAMGFWLIEPG